ncbi:unnamed protein product [Arctogadus glacialis]
MNDLSPGRNLQMLQMSLTSCLFSEKSLPMHLFLLVRPHVCRVSVVSGLFLLPSTVFDLRLTEVKPGRHEVDLVHHNTIKPSGRRHSRSSAVLVETLRFSATLSHCGCMATLHPRYMNRNSFCRLGGFQQRVVLVNVNLSYSGMYRCSLVDSSDVTSSDMAYWFLHVADKGYEVPMDKSMTIVGVLTAVLGISSVACSLYLFKGYVPSFAKRGSRATEEEAREGGEDHKDPAPQGAMATSPADVYASLEHRPGSIYDTLEPPTARQAPGPGRADSGSSKGKEEETPHGDQNQDALECFYENF